MIMKAAHLVVEVSPLVVTIDGGAADEGVKVKSVVSGMRGRWPALSYSSLVSPMMLIVVRPLKPTVGRVVDGVDVTAGGLLGVRGGGKNASARV